jgi:hypothetical protein
MKTGNGRAPAPLGAARLAGDNRAKQDENRKRVQPGLAARARLGVFVGFASFAGAHDLKPAPVAAGLGHASGNTRLVVTSPAMTNAGFPSSHLTMSNSPPNRRAAQPVGWVERRVESGWGIYISTSFCSQEKNA